VTKLAEHRRALELLEQHPGWTDSRIARIVGVHHWTVSRWRVEAGYPPALRQVGNVKRRRQVRVVSLRDVLGRRWLG
jgi:transposase